MSPLEQVVLAFHTLAHALRQLVRPSLWAPWLAVLALQIGVIAGLWWFAHPAISWLAAPVIPVPGGRGRAALPGHLSAHACALRAGRSGDRCAGGAVATGTSTALFGAWFAGRPLRVREGLRRGLSRGAALILANLPLSLLLLGLSYGLDWWLQVGAGPAILRRLAPLLTLGMAVILQAFFLWVNSLLMLDGHSLVAALVSLRGPPHAACGRR